MEWGKAGFARLEIKMVYIAYNLFCKQVVRENGTNLLQHAAFGSFITLNVIILAFCVCHTQLVVCL